MSKHSERRLTPDSGRRSTRTTRTTKPPCRKPSCKNVTKDTRGELDGLTLYKERLPTLHVFIIFILGMAVGEISPEPTDPVYFWLSEHGYLTDPLTNTIAWYFLSAGFYFVLLFALLAFVKLAPHIKKRTVVVWTTYILIGALAFSAFATYDILAPNIPDVWARIAVISILLGVTITGVLYAAGWRIGERSTSKTSR